MPTLNWIGKEKVVSHHLEVPYRVLDRQYTFGDTPDSGNMIIHGDNLEALKALLPEYENRIKCIYIDPPYNTGKEGWVYNDNVNDPHIRKWLGQVVGKEIDDLTRHDKWLCMMYPRLTLLYKLLSERGVILISIDDHEQNTLKCLCDEIIGKDNFIQNMVVNKASEIASGYTIQKHEYCLIYAKDISKFSITGNEKHTISRGTVGNVNQTMPEIVFPKGLKCYNIADGEYTPRQIINSRENITITKGKIIVKNGELAQEVTLKARWRSSNDMRNFFNNDCQRTQAKINGYIEEIYFENDRFIPQIKKLTTSKYSSLYLENKRGSTELEKIGIRFDNPKDSDFIAYLISLISSENDIILDSFAGSGTTAHAVLNLNKQDGGHRKFILCEMCDYAENITAERVRRVMKGYGASTGSAPAVEGTGGSFDFYELGETIFDPATGNLNDNADTEQIRRYLWFSETNVPYPTTDGDAMNRISTHPYYLGTHQHNNYYFYYIKGEETCLDWDFLNTFTEQDRAEMYIIYADRCVLTEEEMMKLNIRFKKIPRDIKRV
ncbi:MAG: site-specific DNA-methyltransferase [Bacteroidales bacterium]|nr:site-specific DNA-methyltransferase [Bacteroidales bacterium]